VTDTHSLVGPEIETVPGIILERARLRGGAPFLHHVRDGTWQTIAWEAYADASLRIGAALVREGLAPGDRVALMAENRVEWLFCDLGIQVAGCVTVPIYPSSLPRLVRHIVTDSGARLLIAGSPDLAARLDPRPETTRVVLIDAEVRDWLQTAGSAEREELDRRIGSVRSEDLASIVYTSGTTGEPKGVMLRHSNLIAAEKAGLQVFDLGPSDILLSFLPYSHVLERVDGVFVPTCAGCSIYLARSIDTLVEDIQAARPTAMIGVPRAFEKIYEAVHDQVSLKPALHRALFQWAIGVGILRMAPESGPGARLLVRLADRLVLDSLRQRLTGGRLRFFISGGAPLNEKVEQFFWALGVKILQGWGMTETTSGATSNTETMHRYRSVGQPLPGLQLKLADDGEILVRGPVVTSGYYNLPQATAEVLSADGWLSTGDMGFLADGFLTITDRKKDLIKTSGGKYIAPLPIEARLQAERAVKAVLVVGNERPSAAALIVPDWDAVRSQLGIAGMPAELKKDPRVRGLFQELVDQCNRDLASFESIKRFALLERDFAENLDELTPTLKPKRKVIGEHFAAEIEALYSASRLHSAPSPATAG